jgi:hypothetical protein
MMDMENINNTYTRFSCLRVKQEFTELHCSAGAEMWMAMNNMFKFLLLLGNVLGKATVFFLVSYIFALNASLYGCLGGILTKGHSVMESVGLGIGFTFGALSLYEICIKAHQVTDTVRSQCVNSSNREYIMERTRNKVLARSVNKQRT